MFLSVFDNDELLILNPMIHEFGAKPFEMVQLIKFRLVDVVEFQHLAQYLVERHTPWNNKIGLLNLLIPINCLKWVFALN